MEASPFSLYESFPLYGAFPFLLCVHTVRTHGEYFSFSSVRFSLLTDWVVGGTRGMIQQKSSSSLSYRRPWWAVLAWAGMSSLWCCPSSISSANHGITHSPRMVLERLLWHVTCPNHLSSLPTWNPQHFVTFRRACTQTFSCKALSEIWVYTNTFK